MSTPIDMKEIEKRAYRATLQDGIMEMYLGLFLGFYAGKLFKFTRANNRL